MSLPEFWAAAQPVLLQILYLILTIAVPILTKYALDWLKAQLSEAQWSQVTKWADMVVQFLEQIGEVRGMSSGDKKEYAVNTLINNAATAGITVNRDDADMLVEAAVQRLRKFKKE